MCHSMVFFYFFSVIIYKVYVDKLSYRIVCIWDESLTRKNEEKNKDVDDYNPIKYREKEQHGLDLLCSLMSKTMLL